MVEKLFVQPETYNLDCFLLAKKVYDSGFKPNWLIALWRGGTEPGMRMQEYLKFKGVPTDHIAIRTSVYEGVEKMGTKVQIHNLDYCIDKINSKDRLVIVDDVFDTGITMASVLKEISLKAGQNMPEIKIATVYYKPKANKTKAVLGTKITPDFYIHETNKWIVFPHELEGLTPEELKKKGRISDLL